MGIAREVRRSARLLELQIIPDAADIGPSDCRPARALEVDAQLLVQAVVSSQLLHGEPEEPFCFEVVVGIVGVEGDARERRQ